MQEMWRERDCISPSMGLMLTEKHSVSSETRTLAACLLCDDHGSHFTEIQVATT